jgi:hypothetical protein
MEPFTRQTLSFVSFQSEVHLGCATGTQQNVRFLAPESVRLGEEVGVIMPVVHPLVFNINDVSPFPYHSSVFFCRNHPVRLWHLILHLNLPLFSPPVGRSLTNSRWIQPRLLGI